jgi:CheY-like chemotaxis protein
MNKTGPVIIVEDDPDDRDILKEVFNKLGYENELIFFENGEKALNYLERTDTMPFIILSDINLPLLNGLELRKKIQLDARLAIKCIPYLYLTTSLNQKMVIDAYSASVQGFFVKENSIAEIEKTIAAIMNYWIRCSAPNNFVNAI